MCLGTVGEFDKRCLALLHKVHKQQFQFALTDHFSAEYSFFSVRMITARESLAAAQEDEPRTQLDPQRRTEERETLLSGPSSTSLGTECERAAPQPWTVPEAKLSTALGFVKSGITLIKSTRTTVLDAGLALLPFQKLL
jgi:hypothetical protein